MPWPALGKLTRFILTWPFPFRQDVVRRPLERYRSLVVLLLKAFHLRFPRPRPSSQAG
jgi:hypothetical protein